MSVSRRLARPMLSAIFVSGGYAALRDPGGRVTAAERVGVPIAERVPGLPTDADTLVRINGAVQVGAGLMLALGKLPRLSSLVLLGSLVPTTVAGHAFWDEDDPAKRAAAQIHFFKNVGLAGGLLIAAFDPDGPPSLGWRARRQIRRGSNQLGGAATAVGAAGKAGRRRGKRKGDQAAASGREQAQDLLAKGRAQAADILPDAATLAAGRQALRSGADQALASGRSAASSLAQSGSDVASGALETGRAQAASAAATARQEAPKLARKARKQAKAAAEQARREAPKLARAARREAEAAAKQARREAPKLARAARREALVVAAAARQGAEQVGDLLPIG